MVEYTLNLSRKFTRSIYTTNLTRNIYVPLIFVEVNMVVGFWRTSFTLKKKLFDTYPRLFIATHTYFLASLRLADEIVFTPSTTPVSRVSL